MTIVWLLFFYPYELSLRLSKKFVLPLNTIKVPPVQRLFYLFPEKNIKFNWLSIYSMYLKWSSVSRLEFKLCLLSCWNLMLVVAMETMEGRENESWEKSTSLCHVTALRETDTVFLSKTGLSFQLGKKGLLLLASGLNWPEVVQIWVSLSRLPHSNSWLIPP